MKDVKRFLGIGIWVVVTFLTLACHESEIPSIDQDEYQEPTKRTQPPVRSLPDDSSIDGPSTDDPSTDDPSTDDSSSHAIDYNRLACTIDVEDQTEIEATDAGAMEIVGEPQKTSILVIFDKSGSMEWSWGDVSKWEAAGNALVDAISQANVLLESQLRVGGVLFPTGGECEVDEMESDRQMDFIAGSDFLSAWEAAAQRNGPGGGTPLERAFHVADRVIARECHGGRLDHLFKIIVLTDGEPNCGTNPETLTTLPSEWLGQGIKTFVFGLPGSDRAEDILNDIAKAGGTNEYYAPYIETPDGGTEETTQDDLSEDIMAVVC